MSRAIPTLVETPPHPAGDVGGTETALTRPNPTGDRIMDTQLHTFGIHWQARPGQATDRSFHDVEIGDPEPDGEGRIWQLYVLGMNVGHVYEAPQSVGECSLGWVTGYSESYEGKGTQSGSTPDALMQAVARAWYLA